jgi:hypothetical protein
VCLSIIFFVLAFTFYSTNHNLETDNAGRKETSFGPGPEPQNSIFHFGFDAKRKHMMDFWLPHD